MEKLFRQIGEQVVEYTESEYAQVEADKIEAAKNLKEAEAKAATKSELLAKLGITEDQARLLLS